ncbi:MAG: hypothetical protein AAGM38_11380 [Pseudomonadota bacterium]
MMTTVSNVGAAQVLVASHQLAENASKRKANERQELNAKGEAKRTDGASETNAVGAADGEQMEARLDGYAPQGAPRRAEAEASAAAAAQTTAELQAGLAARLKLTEGATIESRAAEDEKRTRMLQRAASGYAVSRAALR